MTISSATSAAAANAIVLSQQVAENAAEKAKSSEDITKVAREFEAIFVRRLLERTSLAKASKNGAFGAMVIDAMSDAVTAGSGIGLADQIKDVLSEARAKAGGTA